VSGRAPGLLLVVLVQAAPALARPGSGQSYSGGSSSSSGSSGGSSGSSSGGGSSSSSSSSTSGSSSGVPLDEMPVIFWPMLVVLMVGMVGMAGMALMSAIDKVADARERLAAWTGGRKPKVAPTSPVREGSAQDPWDIVRDVDAEFSGARFEDLAQSLYAAVHRARTRPEEAAALAAYVHPRASAQLAERETPGSVESVVVGSVHVRRVVAIGGFHRAIVDIESNVTYAQGGAASTDYLSETWVFERRQDARTRPSTGVRTFGCPSCGAPAGTTAAGARCASCGQALETTGLDWFLSGATLQVRRKEARQAGGTGPATVPERGTDAPTLVHAGLEAALASLGAEDPGFSVAALEARVATVFEALHRGWAGQDLRVVRPFVTDSLLRSLQADLEGLRKRGLVNAVEKARITRQQVAKLVRGKVDAATVRVWATGYEVTTRGGVLVEGSRASERPYSEYWTLIRGTGVRGAAPAPKVCPPCGAPLSINMAGHCDHCGSHVTSGEFDWVLSRIEQDEAYRG
jgi:predicted lipid-binding transport protein (Tim44 family)